MATTKDELIWPEAHTVNEEGEIFGEIGEIDFYCSRPRGETSQDRVEAGQQICYVIPKAVFSVALTLEDPLGLCLSALSSFRHLVALARVCPSPSRGQYATVRFRFDSCQW